jgi:N-formylglutamate amidohydrolase
MAPGFRRIGPEKPDSPVVISVPHAGRAYSADLLKASRLPRAKLETLEDRLVDRLVWRAVADGAVAIVADVPRAEIDLNRDEREIDPAMIVPMPRSSAMIQSPRSRGGLGLIPTRIAGSGAIWRQRIQAGEMERRIEQVHRPYHEAVAEALAQARTRFGSAILLDCHSMPPRAETNSGPPATVIFGDRHGTTITPDLLEAAVTAARSLGFRTACNAPYAGGYVASRHGRPQRGIHALQIELDRSLYLDRDLRAPGPGFESVCRLIAAVAQALEQRLLEAPDAIAAE